jgi:hypothetical protein
MSIHVEAFIPSTDSFATISLHPYVYTRFARLPESSNNPNEMLVR